MSWLSSGFGSGTSFTGRNGRPVHMWRASEDLQDASEELKSNRDFVMAAVCKNPWNLRHASEELKNNPEIVLAAVCKEPAALQHASEELKSSYDFSMAVVSKVPKALQFLCEELKNNVDVVMAAISKKPGALEHVCDELKNSYDFAMAVVSKVPVALPYLSEEFRENNEIVMKAMSKDSFVIFLVSDELQAKLRYPHRSPLVILNVAFLSGQCASMLFSVRTPLPSVLAESAERLGLEHRQVTATGALLSGFKNIHSLAELEPWKVHNLTLVMSEGLS